FFVFVLLCLIHILLLFIAEKHSLYYIYTGLSKPVDRPGIYQFTAMALLDDIQIDYYNSVEQRHIPKQTWMKEHGCEVDQQGDESKRINEYCYDGEDLLSFDYKESQWVAPVDTNLITKWKWNNVPILKQRTAGYLEKECVDWLKKFREYGDELRKAYVHVFARKSSDESKLKLTCMATGFYAKDMMMTIRKYRTSLPENEIKSTEIRSNPNETFQIKNSVEIQKDGKAEYDCFVSHRTLTEPIIIKWDGKCQNCPPDTVIVMIAAGIGGFLLLAFVAFVVYKLYIIKKKGINGDNDIHKVWCQYVKTLQRYSL
uniref:Immunoglobulin C1-set domain-containing protein n=1 Tax=Sinocyclocheilus anshuiensis TaxID=1608454 RepID=A0A671NRR6_9TELE